jgi:ferredoxin-type protein NapH
LLSAFTGIAAFEWVSPISIFHREIIFGIGTGWAVLCGLFIFELFILKDGWCGYLCPLGAFYSLVGKFALIRIRFNAPTCTHCVECTRVCPEPQVLNFKQATDKGYISAGECTNCGRCITVCPEDTLHYDIRFLIQHHNIQAQQNDPGEKPKVTDQRRKAI